MEGYRRFSFQIKKIIIQSIKLTLQFKTWISRRKFLSKEIRPHEGAYFLVAINCFLLPLTASVRMIQTGSISSLS